MESEDNRPMLVLSFGPVDQGIKLKSSASTAPLLAEPSSQPSMVSLIYELVLLAPLWFQRARPSVAPCRTSRGKGSTR